jgi:hypothetical protein
MVEAVQAYHARAHWGITVLARQKASKLFKERWLASGRKLRELTAADVREGGEAYLAEHPELFQQAIEMIERSPELRKLCKYHK